MAKTPPKKKKGQPPSRRSPRSDQQNEPTIQVGNNEELENNEDNNEIFNSPPRVAMARKKSPTKGRGAKSAKAPKSPSSQGETLPPLPQGNAAVVSTPTQDDENIQHASRAGSLEPEESSETINDINEPVVYTQKETNCTTEVSKDHTAPEGQNDVQDSPEETTTTGQAVNNKEDTIGASEGNSDVQKSLVANEASATTEEQGVIAAEPISEEKGDTEGASQGNIDFQKSSEVNASSATTEEKGVMDAVASPEETGDTEVEDLKAHVPPRNADEESSHDNGSDSSEESRDYETKDMQLNIFEEEDLKPLSFLSVRYPVQLPSNEVVMRIIRNVNVLPIIGDNKALMSLGYFASSCLCYTTMEHHQLFEPPVVFNALHITVEEFIGISALMIDSEILGSLEGVGVPKDTMEKFHLLREQFGKCMLVGDSTEVDNSVFDSLGCNVTYNHETLKEFDTSIAIELSKAIAGFRYKLNTRATELSQEKSDLQWHCDAYNEKADNRTNIVLHMLIIKFLLVLFIRYTMVSVEAIKFIQGKYADEVFPDTEKSLFQQNSATDVYFLLIQGCHLALRNLKSHAIKLSREMETLECTLSPYIGCKDVIQYLLHGNRPEPLPFLKFRWKNGETSPQIEDIMYHWLCFPAYDDETYKSGQDQVLGGR